MAFMVRAQKAFVCPDVPQDENKKTDAFARAAEGIKTPQTKKQPQPRTPRGGARGNGYKKLW